MGRGNHCLRYRLTPSSGLFAWVLVALPVGGISLAAGDRLVERDRQELLKYARDTWRSVAEMADGGALPADGLIRGGDGKWTSSRKTTPTDIGSYLWSVLAAERLKIITKAEAHWRLEQTLKSTQRVERVHGFFFDRLDPAECTILRQAPADGAPIPPIVSSVDNGWLAAGLIMVRNSWPPLRGQAEALLAPMDFGFFYAPYDAANPRRHPGLIRGPYRADQKAFGGFQRLLNTEQRIYSYIGIARGQVPAEQYYRVERTLKPGEQDQRQRPEGRTHTYMGIPVYEGHYTYRGTRIVPSWGGSMFEALMVTLFVPEEEWAPRSWGVNHPLYVGAQIEFGYDEAHYGFWGFSPACNPKGGYRTYGVEALASDPTGYTSNNIELNSGLPIKSAKRQFTNGVVTPHASFLALRYAASQAMENLRKLKDTFPIYTDHGFMDSVNVSSGKVADSVLMLDQGMIMAAIANALADDAMRRAFVDEKMERVLRPLIGMEEFTARPAPAHR